MEKRVKSGLAVSQKHLNLCDSNLGRVGVRSRNDFVEQAIEHYAGFLTVEQNSRYLDRLYSEKLETVLEKQLNKITRNQYKMAVELAKIGYILASCYELPPEFMEHIKNKSEQEVQHMRGTLHLEDLVER